MQRGRHRGADRWELELGGGTTPPHRDDDPKRRLQSLAEAHERSAHHGLPRWIESLDVEVARDDDGAETAVVMPHALVLYGDTRRPPAGLLVSGPGPHHLRKGSVPDRWPPPRWRMRIGRPRCPERPAPRNPASLTQTSDRRPP